MGNLGKLSDFIFSFNNAFKSSCSMSCERRSTSLDCNLEILTFECCICFEQAYLLSWLMSVSASKTLTCEICLRIARGPVAVADVLVRPVHTSKPRSSAWSIGIPTDDRNNCRTAMSAATPATSRSTIGPSSFFPNANRTVIHRHRLARLPPLLRKKLSQTHVAMERMQTPGSRSLSTSTFAAFLAGIVHSSHPRVRILSLSRCLHSPALNFD